MTSGQRHTESKRAIRKQACANRNAQADKDRLSRQVVARFMSLPEYRAAATVMFYVDVRDEVRTQHVLPETLATDKRVIVPYCRADELGLFHLENMEELEPGTLQILEPKAPLRHLPQKQVDLRNVDLVMVPGVAFDRRGGRLGHGRAYYDKLLCQARPDTSLVALAFECQMFPEVPTQDHDVFMDKIVTERAVYAGRGRSTRRL